MRALREPGIGFVITVPLIARDSVLGAITFVSDGTGWSSPRKLVQWATHFEPNLELAKSLARRGGGQHNAHEQIHGG
ncbi:MAG: GAF domain-containing protein, partial [Acidobacteriota bacterium]|nr:GAF domain-containing protein [Acidobacteriota bacterium]